MNAYERIQQGKKDAEKFVMDRVKSGEKEGRLWYIMGYARVRTYNACDRLLKAGKIKFSSTRMGYYRPKTKETGT